MPPAASRGSRPQVVLKAGITLDGRIQDHAGASQWITSPEARAEGHGLRALHDAVLVGSGTVLADDPSLNTRHGRGEDRQPVVLDSRLRTPPDARVMSAGLAPWIYCTPERARGGVLGTAELIGAPRAAGGLDLDFVLRDLKRRGIGSLLVEGGGTVHRSLLDLDVVDEVHLFVAPIALAGGAGWLGGAPHSLGSVRRWRLVDVRRAGPDAWLVLQP